VGRTAPVVRFTLAYSAGVGLGLVGAPIWMAPLFLLLSLSAPISPWTRPRGRRFAGVLGLALTAGLVAASSVGSLHEDCRPPQPGARARLTGHFLATPRAGSAGSAESAPFERSDGCGLVTVVVSRDSVGAPAGGVGSAAPPAGLLLEVVGVWRAGARRPWLRADRVGRVDRFDRASRVERARQMPWTAARWATVRWRDGLVRRLHRLYGDQAPLVAALVLARREGLEPEVREAFAASGVAHLLAISGFHVGVIAALLLGVLRAGGVTRRRARLAAVGGAGAYVAVIGFPDAACRAVLIMALVVGSRARGYPSSRWGPLATAALILIVLDPRRLASVGFQLSFAGAGGLVAWARPLGEAIDSAARERLGRRLPRAMVTAFAAGIAATAGTLPVVAWHFERVSLVGIPVTLLATPLVSLALPGALVSLLVDAVAPEGALFLAGGVSVLLDGLLAVAGAAARPTWATTFISRPTVGACLLGVLAASRLARRPWVGRGTRRALVVAYAAILLLAWPTLVAVGGRGALELWMIDVGQGDAIALRTPRGRWLLVDAGPPIDGDERAYPVVRALRGRGVTRLAALFITHPHADHFGGATAILRNFQVDQVLDPALVVGNRGYADLLGVAEDVGVPWMQSRAGAAFVIDGVTVRTLHPTDSVMAEEARRMDLGASEPNSVSVVLLITWNGFEALLTGDAYVDVERRIMDAVGDIDVLKVGHHGSRTSTDSLFVATVRPEVALISVGRGNRYGHPTREVLDRLNSAGVDVRRSDRQGDVRLLVDRDGRITVATNR
jgi:competence protein ComEC